MGEHTPLRNVRVPDDLWALAKATAKARGETVTDVIRRALVAYVTPPPPTKPKQP